VLEVGKDYLAVGIDPKKTKIVLQSQVPDIALLSMIFSHLVSVARVERNPTVKQEVRQKGFNHEVPMGFFSYPVSQAADIAAFRATVVPVGEDQKPMVELTNEIVHRFNTTYGIDVFCKAEAIIPKHGRLPGVDGKAKMSKSLGNGIQLNASADEISKAVKKMYTDPNHLKAEDPGTVEGNVVFSYLSAFDPNPNEVEELKEHYRRGGLGDSKIKKRLNEVLQELLKPIRERRPQLDQDISYVRQVIQEGTEEGLGAVSRTMNNVRSAIGINYWM
jgi:tryptophanyl-tRNA synthetase